MITGFNGKSTLEGRRKGRQKEEKKEGKGKGKGGKRREVLDFVSLTKISANDHDRQVCPVHNTAYNSYQRVDK